ncbi:MAG: hypothetical protein M3T96_11215 [Acidobacteriota bacterium]|nr:hypothetical protein [Acidobacteriota bacterium]
MNFAFYERAETYGAPDSYGAEYSTAKINFSPANGSVKLLTDKFLVPPLTNETDRPRLIERIEKSLMRFSAKNATSRTPPNSTNGRAAIMRKTALIRRNANLTKNAHCWR